ncbi:calmodulin-binding protein 60 B [Selaginella moellendorffii]|nr:calmodulin-binding protein 60 B [Selaginella moellendorffii]|eukprot:XP_002987748.2 calmodulin-binding protein 60 B [Selaginella moellendorffii]
MTLNPNALREKRPLEKQASFSNRDGLPEEKRQKSLAGVIFEAVKMDSMQKLCTSLEPFLRKVVGEEVERALSKFPSSKLGLKASPPKKIPGPNDKMLRLQFRNKLALPLFTGSKVEGEQGSSIHVVLQDAATGQVVTTGPEASAKLDIVVLEGDFSVDDEDDWTQEEFENHVVKEREGKRPLLTGEAHLTLKEGVGALGELTFTDNSSWIRSRKFRLGVRMSGASSEVLRIREAKTESFTVKDHRGELYKKHYPPALTDEVWRLDKIGKDGAFHKRLNQNGIQSVEDFLRMVVMDPQKLRNVLGNGMSNKMWEGTVEHAKTCVLSGKLHVYYADERHNIGVIFNNIFQLMGLIADGQYVSADSLSDSEKVYVDKLVKVAYENWERVVEYDGEALAVPKPHMLRGLDAHTEDPVPGRQSSRQQQQQQGLLGNQQQRPGSAGNLGRYSSYMP